MKKSSTTKIKKKLKNGHQGHFAILKNRTAVQVIEKKTLNTVLIKAELFFFFFSSDNQSWSVVPEGEGESAAMALSGFIVQLDRGIRPLSSEPETKEVKAGNDAVDGLNKALFLPSLNTRKMHRRSL